MATSARVLSLVACFISYFLGRLGGTSDALMKSYGGGQANGAASDYPQRSSDADTGAAVSFRPVHVFAKEGPVPTKSYSQVGQDGVIMKLIKAHVEKGGTSNKYFVDLAANDAIMFANSLHLEQNGWDGLCIEGNPMYWYGLAAYRKCKVIGAFVGGTVDGAPIDVNLNGVFGGIAAEGFDNAGKSVDAKRQLVTIETIFREMNVPNVIDYLSLDVEGAEYFVMENFPFHTHKIRFMTLERPTKELMFLLDQHGFKRNPKDFAIWGETLWFHPNATVLSAKEVEEVSNLKARASLCWDEKTDPKENCD